MTIFLTAAGLGLLTLAVWMRLAPPAGTTRPWTQWPMKERAVLAGLPGLGLVLLSIPGITAYEPSPLGATWRALVLVPLVVGALLVLWAAFVLPVPGWAKPRWLRVQARVRKQAERRERTRRADERRASRTASDTRERTR
jgi:hypothetical protein